MQMYDKTQKSSVHIMGKVLHVNMLALRGRIYADIMGGGQLAL